MPLKKSTPSKKAAPLKKSAAEECCAKCEKDVALLKKEVASLKSSLAASVKSHNELNAQLSATLESLRSKVDENNNSELKDSRYDDLIKDIILFNDYGKLRKSYKRNKNN